MDADYIIMNMFEKLRAIPENDYEETDRVLYEIKNDLVEYFSEKHFPKRKPKVGSVSFVCNCGDRKTSDDDAMCEKCVQKLFEKFKDIFV